MRVRPVKLVTATMKATLVAVLKSGKLFGRNLRSTDRPFLKLWAESADDPIWANVIADARAQDYGYDGWPTKKLYSELIWYALDARRIAESVKGGFDPVLEHEKAQRDFLLALAKKAEDLAQYFEETEKYSGIANFFHENLKLPVTAEQEAVYRVEPSRLRVQQLQTLHKQVAQLLRQRASREPKGQTFVSREKGKREITAFIHSMTTYMNDFSGKPQHPAVATLTNIAFDVGIDGNDVRKALEPSTRNARALKRKTRARVR
jgi:hypothetical protein